MLKQTVGHSKLGAVRGIALVAALVAVLLFLNYVVLNFIADKVGYTAASISFWVIGGAIAFWMLRRFVLVYIYEIGGNVLRITRKYGKRERLIEDIYLNRIIYVGTPEEAKRRDPNAKVIKVVHSAVKTDKTAMLFNTSQGTETVIFQPDAEMRKRLVEAVKSK